MTANYIDRNQFQIRLAEVEAAGPSKLNAVIATAPAHSPVDGPLTGIAVGIKDNIEAIGLPATAGSRALTAEVKSDAPIVSLLRNAGADIVASLNLSEWANLRSTGSTSGWSAIGGLVGNPWALDRSAGGSSAGSGAAVAAGLVSVAIGTETDGSIVCPASLNGVVGLKPTVGSVSSVGIVPVSTNQDVAGPLAIDVKLAAMVYSVIGNQPALSNELRNFKAIAKQMKVGVARNWLTDHAATDRVFESALQKIEQVVGELRDSDIPANNDEVGEAEFTALIAEMYDDVNSYIRTRRPTNPLANLEAIHAFNLQDDLELRYFGQECFDAALESGGRATEQYRSAREFANKTVRAAQTAALNEFDLLVAPTYGPAWKSDLVLGDRYIGGKVTGPAAITGTPLLCIPMGLVEGLPVGLTIAGSANSELQLLALGQALEEVLGCRAVDGFVAPMRSGERG